LSVGVRGARRGWYGMWEAEGCPQGGGFVSRIEARQKKIPMKERPKQTECWGRKQEGQHDKPMAWVSKGILRGHEQKTAELGKIYISNARRKKGKRAAKKKKKNLWVAQEARKTCRKVISWLCGW